ncbi:hypothetical protein C8Q72DRAFT_505117 [Fomitopsis betulina]|nr:hypothetical protein C8Q72DRAFT_505117 [Fomitopsis betulina]
MILGENFIRGTCRLRLEAMMMPYERTTENAVTRMFCNLCTMRQLMFSTIPDENFAELREVTFGSSMIGMGWFIYPKATVVSVPGHHIIRRWRADFLREVTQMPFPTTFSGKAAILYAKHDEMRAWCLHLAVDVLCKSDNPFNLVLRTTEELRSALIDPDMERIWENSRLGKSGMYEACQ